MAFFYIVGKFQLNLLSREWVENQWRQDFSTDKELPSDYSFALEEEDYFELLTALYDTLIDWLSSSDASTSGNSDSSLDRSSWQTLLNADVDHKGLVAVVASFIKPDVKDLTDDVSRRLALVGSRVYFALLSVRGAQIFNVFNPILFGQAIESLKVLTLLDDVDQNGKKIKGRKKRSESYDNVEITDTDVVHIGDTEKNDLVNTLIAAVGDLKRCLQCLSLKSEEDALMLTITGLVSIARLEKTSPYFVDDPPKMRNVAFLAHRAYKTLLSMCHSRHGNVSTVVRMICRSLLPHLTISAQEMHTNDKTKTIVRSHMIYFIKKIVTVLGEQSYDSVLAIVQQLCARTPDKADVRTRCVQQILTILNCLPPILYRRCCIWICSLVFAETVKGRVTGLEIVCKLLNGDEKPIESGVDRVEIEAVASTSRCNDVVVDDEDDTDNNDDDDDDDDDDGRLAENRVAANSSRVSHRFLLTVLISRAADLAPTVRTKCLSSFAPMILTQTQGLKEIMLDLFVNPYSELGRLNKIDENEAPFFDFRLFFRRRMVIPPENPLPGGTRLMDLIETLAQDQKVFARKGALHVLCNICRLNDKWINQKRIDIMVFNCLDLSVIVRKMMIHCLTELLVNYPNNEMLIKGWVNGVIPLVADNELKCQEKAVEAISAIILGNIQSHHNTQTYLHRLPWKIIELLIEFDMRKLFLYVCNNWVTTKRIGMREMKLLLSHVGTENDGGAWYFIVCLSEFTDFCNPDSLVEYYLDNIYGKAVQEYTSQMVLEALFLNWRNITPAIMEDLVENKFLVSLENFTLPLSSISPIMNICIQYNEQSFTEVAKRIIFNCENYLFRHIGVKSPVNLTNEDTLTRHIFTLGEANAICPGQFSKSAVPLLRNLIGSLLDADEVKWEGKVGRVCKAVAVITLGKFCLQDQMLAKQLVPVLGTLMNSETPTEVKLNTLNTMADLCIRFTSLVEPYLCDICVCLMDRDVRVRKTTLNLMIGLIQEDYIKLRCPHFYYLLHTLHDSEPKIRSTIRSFVVNTILAKNPKIMVHEFIQALYFWNEYEANEAMARIFATISYNPNEKKAFLISGEGNKEKRRALLCFMLEHMMDDFKFKILNSICNEILDGVSDDRIALNGRGIPLVCDAIYIMGCEELRMKITKNKSDDTDEDENGVSETGESRQIIVLAVSCLLKQVFLENVMPSIIRFKRKLQEAKSSLLKDLMVALRSMMKDFKDWMQEAMSSEPTLASEIELDMRLLEEEEEQGEVESRPIEDEGPSTSTALTPINGTVNERSPRYSLTNTSTREFVKTPSPVQQSTSDDDVSSLSTPSQSSQISTIESAKRGIQLVTVTSSSPALGKKRKNQPRCSSDSSSISSRFSSDESPMLPRSSQKRPNRSSSDSSSPSSLDRKQRRRRPRT